MRSNLLILCLSLGLNATARAQTAQDANAPRSSIATPPAASPTPTPTPSVAPSAPPPQIPAASATSPALPASPAPAASPASPLAPAPAPVVDASALKLREIEERINQLKEKVFQSKARLVQLQEVVLHGTIAGSKLVLHHHNEMGSSFRLAHLQYALDGVTIYNRTVAEVPDLDKQSEVDVFDGPVAPGSHQLSVFVEYDGNGFGLFNYLEGYKFRVRAGETFQAEEGHITVIKIVGFEQGNFTTELKDRPAMRFETDATAQLRPANVAAPGAQGSDAAPAKPAEPSPPTTSP